MTATPEVIEPRSPRLLPRLTDANRDFWTGGSTGYLLVPRCRECDRWALPPATTCPACQGPLSSERASGRATVFTWTVNWHQFHPDIPPPNLIAVVVLAEQDDLRLATNLVDCAESDLHVGMPVHVRFETHGEIYYPVFAPAGQP